MTIENKEKFMAYANKRLEEKRAKKKNPNADADDYIVVKLWRFKKIRGRK